jgi:transposase
VSHFIRKVKTKSGAVAVQIITKTGREVTSLVHVGSANNPERLDFLLSVARAKLHEGQIPLFPQTKPPVIFQEQAYSRFLFDQLMLVYRGLGFNHLNDEVFTQLVVARLIEPTSKLDTIRVLREVGLTPPSKDQIYRCLQKAIQQDYRSQLAKLCFQASNPKNLSLLLYDVTTLYFETQKEDGYRKSGLSKERRLEPQIVVGLLVDRSGFPLEIHEFEGNYSEKKTIVPVIDAFCRRHHLDTHHLTVTADAGMLSAPNLNDLERAGFSFIVGSRIAKTPYQIQGWQKTSLEVELTDGQIFDTLQTFGYRKADKIMRRVIYQYKKKRADLDLINLEKQLVKAERVLSGQAPLKKNTFLTLTQAKPTLNLALIQEHRLRAGIKGYVTNLPAPEEDPLGIPAQEIIAAYHQLFQVEKSFRMSKSDLKARPIFHHKLDSIRAHLTIVFAALAVARFVEDRTHISIKRFIQRLRVIKTGTVQIEGKRYPTQPMITEEVEQLINTLGGH